MLLHGISCYPIALGQPTPWDARSFAFAQDVSDDGDILSVEMVPGFFQVTTGDNSITVPDSLNAISALWNANPNAALLEPLDDDAHATRQIRTRYIMHVPPKYIPILVNQRLTPRELWDQLLISLEEEGDINTCRELVDWVVATCFRTAPGGRSHTLRPPPAVPQSDAALFQHRRRVLHHQLPALSTRNALQPDHVQLYATMGQILNETRQATIAAADRATTRTPKTPAAVWTVSLPGLMRLCNVEQVEDLPPLWHSLAAAGAQDRNILQGFMRAIEAHENCARQGPHINPELTKRLLSLTFAGHNRDNLAIGIQPFNIILQDPDDAPGRLHLDEITRTSEEYDLLMSSTATQSLDNL